MERPVYLYLRMLPEIRKEQLHLYVIAMEVVQPNHIRPIFVHRL